MFSMGIFPLLRLQFVPSGAFSLRNPPAGLLGAALDLQGVSRDVLLPGLCASPTLWLARRARKVKTIESASSGARSHPAEPSRARETRAMSATTLKNY